MKTVTNWPRVTTITYTTQVLPHCHRYTTVNTSASMTRALRHGSQEHSRDRQTYAPRSYTVQSSTTGTVYRRTISQLKPDTTFSEHRSTQRLLVSHPTPTDQERGNPRQPVELTDDVAITRSSPTPVISTPELIAMATNRTLNPVCKHSFRACSVREGAGLDTDLCN